MLNQRDTQLVLESYFKECLSFWKSEVKDERLAYEKAIRDAECLTRDPNLPMGELLDEDTKAEFIKYRKMDLGN